MKARYPLQTLAKHQSGPDLGDKNRQCKLHKLYSSNLSVFVCHSSAVVCHSSVTRYYRNSICNFLAPFERFYNQLKQEPVNTRSGFFLNSVKAKLKDIVYSGFRSYSRPNAFYSQDELNILKDLRNDSSIIIMKPDKGNGVVILNKHDYNKKMDEILSDTSKFEPLKDDAIKLTLKRENQVKSLLKKLKADNCIDEITYNNCIPQAHV